MVCPGPFCKFRICLSCCSDDSKVKDDKGHPCKKILEREEMQLVCDFCAEFKPGIVSCERCNVDICIACSRDETLNIKKIIAQKRMDRHWYGKSEDG